ncbi:MAG TPA: DUF4910 domain-containing protein [Candidatus Ozemobacteraceae bacterium]
MKKLSEEIAHYLQRLFPLNRSLTGEGNRETLRIISEIAPVRLFEYPSGSRIYDWMIPDEWHVREAWIKDSSGRILVDFLRNNLHLMGYSVPVRRTMSFAELRPHLHVHPFLKDAIPYHTSYFKKQWGFCLSTEQLESLFSPEGIYEVCVDSELKPGSLTVGEILLPGTSQKEYLVSTYICHPSLANDNLSGILLTALLAREWATRKRNFGYRFIFVPETLGALAYCANNEAAVKDLMGALVVTGVGGPGSFSYKQSFQKEHFLNGMVEDTLNELHRAFLTYPFDIHGSDERQYSSPGFRINTVTISRDRYYEYPEYHSSLDNLEFVRPEYLLSCYEAYLRLLEKMDQNLVFIRTEPHGEPRLGARGLYPETGGGSGPNGMERVSWT